MPQDPPGIEERTLTASPETQTPRLASTTDDYDFQPGSNGFTIIRDESEDRELQLSNKLRKGDEKRNLHPYVQILSISDLEAAEALENAAFPPNERCSKEKVCLKQNIYSSLVLTSATMYCSCDTSSLCFFFFFCGQHLRDLTVR